MVGIGYDIHKLVVGRKLFLGGVQIDFEKGLLGHSDGDALIHAICDALLGAANLGDIGAHFPPTDARYKNLSSLKILRSVNKFLEDSGFLVKGIDTIVIAEEPKIQPHIKDMKIAIATAIGISEDVISIKGKTNEGFGGIGAGQAIAAWAICEIGRIYATPEG
ncbi:MAG: 2-C-methyl-D-erythritol 2,4-cyclodiphosphate synthase [bacterium]